MITYPQLRKLFLDFFASKGHVIVASSKLSQTDDPSVLLTTAGMQQFKPYYTGEKNPETNFKSRRVASIQKCFRLTDIDNIGDDSHNTFFEMLGNFSFGDYFKKETIAWAYEFLSTTLHIERNRIYPTIFKGSEEIPLDEESRNILLSLGFKDEEIKRQGAEDNFWGPTGTEGPCGPTVEFYVDGLEVWNLVFNEYYKKADGSYKKLPHPGVDTGMGVERIFCRVNQLQSIFDTELFTPLLAIIRASGYAHTPDSLRAERIIADHLKGATFLTAEGLIPSNVKQGYILRRILRRVFSRGSKLGISDEQLTTLVKNIIQWYAPYHPELSAQEKILAIIFDEKNKFQKILTQGTKAFEKIAAKAPKGALNTEELFTLFQSYGFPREVIIDLAQERKLSVDINAFDALFKAHQEKSRVVQEKKIGGIRANPTYREIKLHTATHLLHQALKEVLGSPVRQMGSDIDESRLRFDINFDRALTSDEIKKIEKRVNAKIKDDLDVTHVAMPLEQALATGAMSFFKEKYPPTVKVYFIGDYSKEICNGPHVKKTSELKNFTISKEEGIGQGLRRIKAMVE